MTVWLSFIMKFQILPKCIDKSLNLGVELNDETIAIHGEILNESIQIDIRVTSEKVHDLTPETVIGMFLSYNIFLKCLK